MPRALWLMLAAHAVLALLLWGSGSPHGSWTFECGVGALAYDLGHGLNPQWPLPDYYDKWTTGYLLTALLAAPLMWAVPPIYALKITALVTSSAAAIAGWSLVRRLVDARAGLLAAALLLFCPPQLWFHATNAGDYHHTELAWELGLFAVLAEIVVAGRRGAGWFAVFGLLAGLTVMNSFASAPYAVLAVAALLWLRPEVRRSRQAWWMLPPALAGAFPLLAKVVAHQPYGIPPAENAYELSYGTVSQTLRERVWKLLALPDRFADNLGFADAAWSWGLSGLGSVVDRLAAGGLILGFAATLVALPALLRRQDRALRLLPTICAGILVGAYLVLPMTIVDGDPATGQFRDHRFLPPLMAFGALAVALTATGRWRIAAAALAGLGALGQLAMVSWSTLDPGIDYRGRCYDVLGMYASRHVDEGSDGPWPRTELCDGFGEHTAECWLGRSWGVGMRHLDGGWVRPGRPGADAKFDAAADACRRLPDPRLQRGCFRHAGWALNWAATSDPNTPATVGLVQRCAGFVEPHEAAWCEEGLGFWLGDHYAAWPDKAPHLVEPIAGRPEMARAIARGLGAWAGHAYGDADAAGAICAAWGPQGLPPESCRAAVAEAHALRAAGPLVW